VTRQSGDRDNQSSDVGNKSSDVNRPPSDVDREPSVNLPMATPPSELEQSLPENVHQGQFNDRSVVGKV
jgi:hypothetical protein